MWDIICELNRQNTKKIYVSGGFSVFTLIYLRELSKTSMGIIYVHTCQKATSEIMFKSVCWPSEKCRWLFVSIYPTMVGHRLQKCGLNHHGYLRFHRKKGLNQQTVRKITSQHNQHTTVTLHHLLNWYVNFTSQHNMFFLKRK